MKLFKKALLATAIFGAMGAQAADLTDAVKATSAQGLEVGAVSDSSVRAIVRQQLEAGDTITLTFGAGVTGINGVAVDADGDAVSSADDISTDKTNKVGILYGSGTYKLTPISTSTSTTGIVTVVLEVKTGDPVTKDSSFEIQVLGANLDKSKAAAATVTYSAKSGLTGDAIDTTGDNTGAFIRTVDQYSASVKTKANAVIKRDDLTVFTSGFVPATTTPVVAAITTADTIVLTIKDDQKLLSAASGVKVVAKVTIEGDFSNDAFNTANNNVATNVTVVSANGEEVASNIAVAADNKSISFDIVDDITTAGIANDYTIQFDNAGETIKASDFVATISVDADNSVTTNTAQNALVDANAGEWFVDATLINVPYFPVGFEGLSTSVHFANEGSADVNVIMTAIDDSGKVYDAVDMGDLAGDTVTRFKQTEIMSKLGITEATKLSVTFNIDATDGVVNAYAFSNAGTGRQALVTSQQNSK